MITFNFQKDSLGYSKGNDGVLDGGGEGEEKRRDTKAKINRLGPWTGYMEGLWGMFQLTARFQASEYQCYSLNRRRAEGRSGITTSQRTMICQERALRSTEHC